MSSYMRPRHPGATVFFTVTVAQRGCDLLVREVETLRHAVRVTRAERPFVINAWVVLPDHMHCVWTLPEGDSDYSTRMGAIKARFSIMTRRAGFTPPIPAKIHRKGQVGIWQKRFWEHHIRDEADFRAHLRYCWINPVKHGFVEHPADWPHSSYHRDGGDAIL